jgi:hypothetical protein
MAKLKDDPHSEALIAAGYDPEAEVVDREITPAHMKLARAGLRARPKIKNMPRN